MAPSVLLTGLLSTLLLCQSLCESNAKSVLVIGEAAATKQTHSKFLSALTERGQTLTFKTVTAKTLSLKSDGEYQYTTIVLLAPQASLAAKLPITHILDFIDDGHNLFLATGPSYSTYVEKLAEAIGIDLDERGNLMTDYQNAFPLANQTVNSFIRAGDWVPHAFQTAVSTSAAEVAFHGPGATLFKDNELVHALLWGTGSSFGRPAPATTTTTTTAKSTAKPLTAVPRVAGAGSVLAAAICTLANSRATWFGSFDALSNAVFETAGASHAAAMQRLVQWTVGASGVLRITRMAHGRVASGGAGEGEGGPSDYRVKDEIEFAIEVEKWDGDTGAWHGFVTEDMQVELVMMDPWVRARLHMVEGRPGLYKAKINVPDQIGVYKFKVEYFRPGLTGVKLEKSVAVRPFLHNEYERFIPMALPYYAASFSMLIGVLLLGFVVLCGDDETAWTEYLYGPTQSKPGRRKAE